MKIDKNFYLENGLQDIYASVNKAEEVRTFVNALFSQFPFSQFWRFCIDGAKQETDSWPGFEAREPGYLQGMFQVFQTMFADLGKPLTIHMLQEYHQLATENVSIKLLSKENKGDWRSKDAFFFINETNATVEGILELIKRLEEGDDNFLLAKDNVTLPEEIEVDCYDIINANTFQKVLNDKLDYYIRRYQKDPSDPQTKSLIKRNLAEFILKGNYAFRTQHAEHYRLTDDESAIDVIPAAINLRDTLLSKIQHILQRHHKLLVLNDNSEQQLRLIVRTVQDLEQLHPFKDANCRVFVIIFLNKLLIESGFPPTMLHDPNCFDAFTVEQILVEVKNGMLEFQRVAKLTDDTFQLEPPVELSTSLQNYFYHLNITLKNTMQFILSNGQCPPNLTPSYDYESITPSLNQKQAETSVQPSDFRGYSLLNK